MKLIGRAGHTGHMTSTRHDNGLIYIIFGENPRQGKRKVHIVEVNQQDQYRLIKTYQQDRDFSNHVAHAAFEIVPSGDMVVFLAITQLDTDGVERAFLWQDRIPNAVAPFTPSAHVYEYMPSAVDLTARERSQGAFDKAEQTVGEIKLLRGQMREYESEIEAKIVRHVAAKFGDIMGKVNLLINAQIKSLRDEVWSKLIADKIFVELNNPSAPLPNKIKEFIKGINNGG